MAERLSFFCKMCYEKFHYSKEGRLLDILTGNKEAPFGSCIYKHE